VITNSNIIFTEEFLTAHADEVDWGFVSKHIEPKEYSFEFFHVFRDDIDWEIIETYLKKLTTDFCHEFEENLKYKYWLKDGKIHRDGDLPAAIGKDGTLYWLKENKTHRIHSPAVVFPNGETQWYRKGELHRWFGPAIDCPDGTKVWSLFGKKHRFFAPAVVRADGNNTWYFNGKEYTKKEYFSLGFVKDGDNYMWDSEWLEIYTGFRKINLKFGPYDYYDPYPHIDFSLGYLQFYIRLPFNNDIFKSNPITYGFQFEGNNWFPDSIEFFLHKKTKIVRFPWKLKWFRTSCLLKDGSFFHKNYENVKHRVDKDTLYQEVFDFRYEMEDGKVQERKATVGVLVLEYKTHWFGFTKKKKYLTIKFNDRVGEDYSSHKYGVKETRIRMLKNETTRECLKRLEKIKDLEYAV